MHWFIKCIIYLNSLTFIYKICFSLAKVHKSLCLQTQSWVQQPNILGPRSVLIVSAIIMSKKPPTNGLKSPTCTLYTPRTLYHFILKTIQFNLYCHNFNFTFLSVSQTVLGRHPVAYQPLINSLKSPNCNVYVPRISYKSIVPFFLQQ